MATDAGFIEYVCDQLRDAGGITVTRMFGEYGVYRHGKIVALACDNQLFVKPTPAGEAVLGTPTLGPPYPGAKPYFNVSDLLDDAVTLARLIVATDAALPAAKKKRSPAKKVVPRKAAAPKQKVAARKTAAPKKKVAAGKSPKRR
ncbi:MAG: TfoX/Sxy family protein [Gemmatimonadota bacterium]